MSVPLRVLIVDDSPEDVASLLCEIRRGGYEVTSRRVGDTATMKTALEEMDWDFVFFNSSTANLPGSKALRLLKKSGLGAPFIIICNKADEDRAAAIMMEGADDYFIHGEFKRLLPLLAHEQCAHEMRRERKRVEERLLRSEERFRSWFDLGLIGMAITSPTKGCMEVNDKLCEILGYDRSELLKMKWTELTHPDDLAVDVAHFNRVLAGEIDGYSIDKRFIRKDGQIINGTISVKCLRRADGSVDYFVVLLQDITERKQAEGALRASKEFSENLIQTANVIILSLDCDGNIEIFNQAAEKITGYTLSELKGKNWFETLVPKDRYLYVWEEFQRLLAGGIPESFENPILTKTGEERYIIWQNNQVRVNGKVVATISFGNDITERKRAEEELRSSRQQLRDLSTRLQAILEEQRGRISREIHDDLGQQLTMLKIDLSLLRKKLPRNLDSLREQAKSMTILVDTIIHSIRRISAELRPWVLDDLGLTAAIEWQVMEFKVRTGIQCRFESIPERS